MQETVANKRSLLSWQWVLTSWPLVTTEGSSLSANKNAAKIHQPGRLQLPSCMHPQPLSEVINTKIRLASLMTMSRLKKAKVNRGSHKHTISGDNGK